MTQSGGTVEADDEPVIQRAIEEWATVQGGPRPNDTTLAHYIAVSLREAHRDD